MFYVLGCTNLQTYWRKLSILCAAYVTDTTFPGNIKYAQLKTVTEAKCTCY